MKIEDLFDVLGEADEKYIEESVPKGLTEKPYGKEEKILMPKKQRKFNFSSFASPIAAMLVLAMLLIPSLIISENDGKDYDYAERVSSRLSADMVYFNNNVAGLNRLSNSIGSLSIDDITIPDIKDSYSDESEICASANSLSADFAKKSISTVLCSTGKPHNESTNAVFSPASLFMSLAMLSEITDGDTRREIMTLLGEADIETVRKRADSVFDYIYRNNDYQKRVIANSLWLRDDILYNANVMKILADRYNTAAFCGKMGTADVDLMLAYWIASQTGGILGNVNNDMHLDEDTVINLANTMYFKGCWEEEFKEEMTERGVFHSSDGNIVCDFMKKATYGGYYKGKNYTAIDLDYYSGGTMTLILPDKGTTPETLLRDDKALEFMLERKHSAGDGEDVDILLEVPKFDVTSSLNLNDELSALGLNSCFDGRSSDFSPLTVEKLDELYVSAVDQQVRVAVDEKGTVAASLTNITVSYKGVPGTEHLVKLTFDRPFIFVINGAENLPLFVGVINNPVK